MIRERKEGTVEERPDQGDKQVKEVADIEMGKIYRIHYAMGTNIVIPIQKSYRAGWIEVKTMGREPITEKDIEIAAIRDESLADWGVIPYDTGMWNRTNWLENIKKNKMITKKEATDLLSRVADKLEYRAIELASDIEKLRVLAHQFREETFILPTPSTIEKGQSYITKSKDGFYGGLKLVVTKVEKGDTRDGYVHYRTEPQKGKDTCRVWWIKDYCYRIWG